MASPTALMEDAFDRFEQSYNHRELYVPDTMLSRPSQSLGRSIGLSRPVRNNSLPSASIVIDPTIHPALQPPKSGAKGRTSDFAPEAQILFSKKINLDCLSRLMNEVSPSLASDPPKMIDSSYIDQITDEQELLAIASRAQARIRAIRSPYSIIIDVHQSFPFRKLPREVRDMIYGYLLVSPAMSENDAIHSNSQWGASRKYCLSPAILRTNRQIYLEASKVLYEQNTFVVSCLGGYAHSHVDRKEFPSTLTRYSKGHPTNLDDLPKYGIVPSFHKVRKWKVLVSCHTGKTELPLEIRNFCREICKSKSITIKVEMLDLSTCKGWAANSGGHYSWLTPHVRSSTPFDMEKVLEPFRLLRDVKSMEFKVDAGDMHHWPLLAEIKSLVQSSTDVDRVFKMYEKVLKYAQSFEHSYTIRYDMAVRDWKCQHLTDGEEQESINALLLMDMRKVCDINLFKTETPHPVEKALEFAKYASDENHVEIFKKHRKIIVEFLEPQYQRMMTAHEQLIEWIKVQAKTSFFKEIVPRRVPDSKRIEQAEQIKTLLQGTMLLEKYGATCHRDLTPEIEMLVKLHPDLFDSYYKNGAREEGIATCYKELRGSQKWYFWRDGFRAAAEDMIGQHLEIRKARKEVFEADRAGADVGCTIDVETWRKDEKLDWGDSESVTDSKPISEGVSNSDDDDDSDNGSIDISEDDPEDDLDSEGLSDDISDIISDVDSDDDSFFDE